MRPNGGGNNSLKLALKSSPLKNNFCVYTFDIVSESNNFKNIVLDLSKSNIITILNKKIKIGKIKKPDIIIASPLCQSFSLAMRSISNLKDKKGKFFSGNPHHFWNHDTSKVETWPNTKNITWNGFSGNSYPGGRKTVPKFVGELGERCIQNIIKIICYFKPINYYIENPATSLIWKYIKYNLKFNGKLSIAHYSAYDRNFSRKPTGFLSNIKLTLSKQNHKEIYVKKGIGNNYFLVLSGACKNNKADELKRKNIERKLSNKMKKKVHVSLKYKANAMERSHIPSKLIIDILQQFMKNINSAKPIKTKFSFNRKIFTKWSKNPPTRKVMLSYGSI